MRDIPVLNCFVRVRFPNMRRRGARRGSSRPDHPCEYDVASMAAPVNASIQVRRYGAQARTVRERI